jgi:AcrR family transcriptional regulator
MGVPERRQREKTERRESILAAAERVFVRKGISCSTMEDIAREAELSKGALYLYFQSKDELYLSIALRAADEFRERYAAALSRMSDRSGFEALSEGLHEYVRYAQEQHDRFLAAMSWMSVEYPVDGSAPLFQEYSQSIDRIRALAVETIDRGQADGSIRADIPAVRMSVQLWGATLGVIMLDANQQEIARRMPGAAVGNLASEFADLVLAGVRAGAAR